jgi:hypothetical protein
MPPNTACTLILLHGLGSQSEDWSQRFRDSFAEALGPDAPRVHMVDAYWGPLSTRDHLLHPRVALDAAPNARLGVADEAYNRAIVEFTLALGREAGVQPAPQPGGRTFGPGDVFDAIRGKLPGGTELLVDVGNYVGRNGVRTAVQQVVHDKLAEAHRVAPGVPIVLATHSQGTIISYDVLRQAGGSYPQLRTWITQGSPLGKYLTLFQWGAERLGIPTTLRWLNLWDAEDLVGKALDPLVLWQDRGWDDLRPLDVQVDNVRRAHDAHDHWHNPEVVAHIKEEVSRFLA